MRILLIEDDELIVNSLAKALADQHYVVDIATDGQTGWDLLESFTYDLILLDVVLPKLDGIRLCQQLRSQGNQTPILLLTAHDTSTNRVMGLDAGADDYVAKPFDLQELLARIRALVRRGGAVLPPLLEWRNLQLNPSTCEVTCSGESLHLTPKEYGLLELFLRNNQRIFSCSALIDHLWSLEEPPTEETVRSHVKGLRQKLKAAGIADDPLETVYGIGYRLKPSEAGSKGAGKPGGKRAREDLANRSSIQREVEQAGFPPSNGPYAKSTLTTKAAVEATRVWEQAKESLNRRVAVIEQATDLLLQQRLNEELRQQAERETHKLAGSLGMFGIDEGSRLAHAIEPLFAPGATLDLQQKQHLAQLVERLRQALQHLDARSGAEWLSADSLNDERPLLLIVHTDRVMAETLAAEAVGWGMRSQIAVTFAMAKKQLAKQIPDAVLLDLPMETLKRGRVPSEALTLMSELSRYTPPVPVIAVAAQENLTDRITLTRLGGRRVLQKPVSPAQALEAVMQVLQHTQTDEARVMVVDDDPHVLTILQTLLEPWGLKVTTLDNPMRFLEVLTIASPDLLILDVEMPNVSGIELCQVVRNDPRWSGLPILFLTAHGNAETMHRVFAAGADDYVGKPIVGPELVTRILNRLERSRLLRSLAETDALTGVANRRKSTHLLTQWLQWSDRHHQPFCFAVLDLDRLKLINHQHGHAVGDQVLFRFGKLLRQTFHSEDVVGRWAGTEFIIGMAGMTKRDGVQRLSEVLKNLRQIEFKTHSGAAFSVTFSAGVVQCPQDGTDLQSLYQAADAVLNQAKTAGGDRILCASSPGKR